MDQLEETLPLRGAEHTVVVTDAISEQSPVKKSKTPHDLAMPKEDRTRRLALLQEKQAQIKRDHDQEIAGLEEEISYQKELLRCRREQKRQQRHREKLRERLASLQRKLENDSDFDTDDEDARSEAGGIMSQKAFGEGTGTMFMPPRFPVPEDQASDNASCVEINEDGIDVEPDIDDEPNVWPLDVSLAKQEWEEQKKIQEQENDALDSLMDMVGLEQVKGQFMVIKNLVDTARRQNADLTEESFGAVLTGSQGTGKTTVAGLYAQFLSSMGIITDPLQLRETTGSLLYDKGVDECKYIIDNLLRYRDYSDDGYLKRTRGVIFIDDAHNLAPRGVNGVFSYLVDEIRRLQGQVVFLFAGPVKEMQTFMALSPSLRSLVPFTFKFDDFSEGELHSILVRQFRSKFQGKMRIEEGINGLPMRILIRRISRGRDGGYFANARDVQNTLLRVLLRQSARLSQNRKSQGQEQEQDQHQDQDQEQDQSNDMYLTQTDLIGHPPLAALESSAAWRQLQGMIGLDSVKQSVRALIARLQFNYDRELEEKPLIESSLNKVFLGNPGTGKTTVAKYYAQILVDLGLLSDGGVILKTSNDFTGEHLGGSENRTKAILDSAQGKVLVIDEAYGFSRGTAFMEAVVDTIVGEVQATATEDRAVLLLGYKDEMEDMFQRVNPGLGRRFPLSSAFVFQDYSDEELRSILELKLQSQGFTASEEAKLVAMNVLERSRNHQNFGNASEIDILLDRAKAAQQIRLNKKNDNSIPCSTELTEMDFDADFDRHDRAESNIRDAFEHFVGAEKLISQFQGYQRIVQNSKALGLDPRDHIPFNFIFRGPPGTGKTTTARKMGQIFYDLGFLATSEVEVCSASELIGKYVGHTGPKTQKIFQRALGKVLFIDEAYRLGHGSFGKEAVGELVNILTLPKYKNKLVTVIAGYDRDINRLLASNPGFGSRFPEVLEFPSLSSSQCQELLVRLLQEKRLEVSCMQLPRVFEKVQDLFQTLSDLPAWGNARDVENLATALFGRIMSAPTSPPTIDLRAEWIYEKIYEMITERRKRSEDAGSVGRSSLFDQVDETPDDLSLKSSTDLQTTSEHSASQSKMVVDVKSEVAEADLVTIQAKPSNEERESGVTIEAWLELEENKAESEKAKSSLGKEEEIQRYLNQSGFCEMGYEWIQEHNGYRCAGGSHFMSHDDIFRAIY